MRTRALFRPKRGNNRIGREGNAANGKKVLDFVLSDESQAMWGNAYLRPVFADKLSKEAKSKFLPDADYARAKPIDLKRLSGAFQAKGVKTP